jgi:hypothetical protein
LELVAAHGFELLAGKKYVETRKKKMRNREFSKNKMPKEHAALGYARGGI